MNDNDPASYAPSYFWQAWRTYREHDPYGVLENATMDDRSLMLGGEVNMWGEGIDDTNFIPHVFPSTTAAAESMWSGSNGLDNAGGRLADHRCALVRAGIAASPVGPGAPCGRV